VEKQQLLAGCAAKFISQPSAVSRKNNPCGQGGHAAPDQGHACRNRRQLRKIKHTQLCRRSGPRQARDKSEILSEKEPGQLGGDFEVARLHRGEGWSAVKDLPQN
jgi:hypothetical protein